ncbi:acyl-CoA thioesterase [bacterium]|nr:acyl-CoA thioesterase [bacterium]
MEYKFSFELRVRFSETDAQQIVHNSKYLTYFEIGRVEYLRHLGVPYQQFRDKGYDFVLVVSHVEYKSPAVFDQLLRLQVRVEWLKRSSFQFNYTLADATKDFIVAEGYTIHATVDRTTLKPCHFPEDLCALVEKFEERPLRINS